MELYSKLFICNLCLVGKICCRKSHMQTIQSIARTYFFLPMRNDDIKVKFQWIIRHSVNRRWLCINYRQAWQTNKRAYVNRNKYEEAATTPTPTPTDDDDDDDDVMTKKRQLEINVVLCYLIECWRVRAHARLHINLSRHGEWKI